MHLSPPHEPSPDWALFLDFDGTLVEFAPAPDAIEVNRELAPLLRELEVFLNGALAIISGRRIAEIDRHLGLALDNVSGLHGYEYRRGGTILPDPAGPQPGIGFLDQIRPHLQAFVEARSGLLLEDKGKSLALHYRNAPEYDAACRELMAELVAGAKDSLTVLDGNMVLELKLAGIDKGAAVHRFMTSPPFAGRTPVFVGDDITDEYGFQAAADLGGTGIIVGDREPTAATSRLRDVADMFAWLHKGRQRLAQPPGQGGLQNRSRKN